MSWFKEQLLFSRIEILGLVGIIGIGMLGLTIQYIPKQENQLYDLQLSDILIDEEYEEFIEKPKDRFETQPSVVSKNKNKNFTNRKTEERRRVFDFDPNKISKDSLVLLGFKSYLADRWVKFRSKGKKYRDIDDVLSIYGIDTSLVFKINEHFLFPEKQLFHKEKKKEWTEENKAVEIEEAKATTKEKNNSNSKTYGVKVSEPLAILDINSSTKEELMEVKGIGPKFASRIIKYRSILGGYSNTKQLLEVYGMTDSTFLVIKDQLAILSPPEKIKVNTVSQKQLSEHYLITYKMAKLIYAYRDEHGAFVDASAFKAIKGINEEKIEKIIPYLDFAL